MAAYLGTGDSFERAIAEFATRYADVNEADHVRLLDAIDRGTIAASLEA